MIQLRTYEGALVKAGLGPVAGVDEAGRGACFGPVTVAACILPPEPVRGLEILTDSKKLTSAQRDRLFDIICARAVAYSVIHIDASDIDARGIQHANLDGARRAVDALAPRPGYVLVDAFRIPGLTVPQLPIIGGDASARAVAAASVLAKVSRDRLVDKLACDEAYGRYGIANHKGYGTVAHMDAVRRHGASDLHRYTYKNVAEAHALYLEQSTGGAHANER
nr:ribonuclease HII [Corynebacterium aquatimens]